MLNFMLELGARIEALEKGSQTRPGSLRASAFRASNRKNACLIARCGIVSPGLNESEEDPLRAVVVLFY